MEVSIKECRFTYGKLTKLLYVNERQIYDGALIGAYLAQLNNGLIATKVGKPTSKGTKITYKVSESDKEIENYVKKINGMIDEYNLKYKNHKLNHLSKMQ